MLTTLGIVTALVASSVAIGQPVAKADEAESVPKVKLIIPDEFSKFTVRAILEFDIPEGWHTYWPGQNDTGTPIVTTWTLPDGFSVSKPYFPSPTRHSGSGGLLDYALEGKFQIHYSITVPPERQGKGLDPSSSWVPINVQVDYLVCKEACVPHTATLRQGATIYHPLGIECGTGLLDRAEALHRTHPRALPESPENKLALRVSTLAWEWQALESVQTLIIRARPTPGTPVAAKHLEFYPYEDSAELLNPITSGITDTGELKLTFKPQGKLKPGDKPKPVYGVVRVGSGPTSPTYEIKIDLPAAADTTSAKPAESSAPLPPPLPPAGNNPSAVPPAK